MFNAAGSMVPEPSIMLPPIPFMDVVTTGWDEAEYMATGRSRRGWKGDSDRQAVLTVTALVRQSAGASCWRRAVERSLPVMLEGAVTVDGQRRETLHAGSSGANRLSSKRLGRPLFPGLALP